MKSDCFRAVTFHITMKKLLLIALLSLACAASAQQAEPVRYEVNCWGKTQGSHFQSLGEKGGIMVSETDKTDKDKHRLWSFACVDTSLYELRNNLIPLPEKLKFFDSNNDDRFVAFLFVNEDNKKASEAIEAVKIAVDGKKVTLSMKYSQAKLVELIEEWDKDERAKAQQIKAADK